MSQVGRISGPLLTSNLERNGINLAFRNTSSDTQLLYLDVNTNKIGINKGVAGYDVDIAGTARSTNLITDTSTIANYTIENNNLNLLYESSDELNLYKRFIFSVAFKKN